MKNNLRRKLYSYTSNGKTQRVWCNYWEFLLLKLCYDDNGLTKQEYKDYKKYNTNKNEKKLWIQ